MEPYGKTVLVTGAAGGLGRTIVEYLAACGDHLWAVDIDERRLQSLHGIPHVTTVPADVTAPASIQAAFAQVQAQGDGLDGLVNCAGIFAGGPLVEIPADDVRRILEINVLGVVRITRAFFPLLRQRRGRIINISSESGRFVAPFVGPYCMSKYALEAYSDALRRELMPLGMPVVIIQPGAMRTAFLDGPPTIFARCADGSCFEASLRKGQRWAAQERDSAADPIKVARVVSHALRTRHPRLRYRVCNHLGRSLLELLPARWVDTLLRWAM